MSLQPVVTTRSRVNAIGNALWVLTLACGHQAEVRKYTRSGAARRPPQRLKCRLCEAQAPPPAHEERGARIGHFCAECGEELQDGEDCCDTHPNAPIDSVSVPHAH